MKLTGLVAAVLLLLFSVNALAGPKQLDHPVMAPGIPGIGTAYKSGPKQ